MSKIYKLNLTKQTCEGVHLEVRPTQSAQKELVELVSA